MCAQPKAAMERRFRILVVDSDKEVRAMVSAVLGVDTCDTCDTCEVVLEESTERLERILLENSHFDVVLIGLVDPVEKALGLIHVVKKISPNTEVIVMSRFAEVGLWIESIQRGAHDYLSKPVDKKELQRIMGNALGTTKIV